SRNNPLERLVDVRRALLSPRRQRVVAGSLLNGVVRRPVEQLDGEIGAGTSGQEILKGRRLREVLRGGKWGGQDGGQLDRFSALLQVLLKRSPPPPALRVLIAVEQDDDQRRKLPEKKRVDRQRDEHGEVNTG